MYLVSKSFLSSALFTVQGGSPPLITALGAPVVPIPPIHRPKTRQRGRLLKALLRERPGLLRRLLRRLSFVTETKCTQSITEDILGTGNVGNF